MGENINIEAKQNSIQAINDYVADKSKGNLNGRLVIIKSKGKDQQIAYEKLSTTPKGKKSEKSSLAEVKAFCKAHDIDCQDLDNLEPTFNEFRDAGRKSWNQENLQKNIRNNEIMEALSNPERLSKLSPPLQIAELKIVADNLPYEQVCKIIDGFKKSTALQSKHTDVLKVMKERELALAAEAVKEYKEETHSDITVNIMKLKESDSPLTNLGGRDLLQWGIDNKKSTLVAAIMRRISQAEAKQVIREHENNLWVDNLDKSIWIL